MFQHKNNNDVLKTADRFYVKHFGNWRKFCKKIVQSVSIELSSPPVASLLYDGLTVGMSTNRQSRVTLIRAGRITASVCHVQIYNALH